MDAARTKEETCFSYHSMTAQPAAKRARPPALDAAVSTLEVPELGNFFGLFVMADGNCLVSTRQHTLQLLTPAGQLALIAGDEDEDAGFEDGKGANARFYNPCGMTVDAAGHIVVADSGNDALRRVSKAGEVSTLAGNGERGFEDGQGDAARFN
jgi:hypothetical protein